ncbi:hypothetical protein [Paenibacillus koleovorans]|uniref:hypothetical protein n=1 Tax=Paenibacillus koleovorans TaxID=121608 RepID=UPI000FD8D786|nr:hypothetical protein [Paenibacillus koleovorans]
MKFALAKARITPEQPVFLAGFGGRKTKREGVLDDIYAKTALLQEGNMTLLVVTLDALGGDRSFMTGIRAALKEAFGLNAEQILVNFSHTHFSMYLTGEEPTGRRGGYSMGQDHWPERDLDVDYSEDIEYYRRLRDQLVALAAECYAKLEVGTLQAVQGTTAANISRRLTTAEGVGMRPNAKERIDRDLSVLQLTDRSGMMRGLLFSFACHPTSMSANQISADFVGEACTRLEAMHPGCTALFLQGCAGDIKPSAGVNGDSFRSLSEMEMREAGDTVAEEVNAVLASLPNPTQPAANRGGHWQAALRDVRLFTERWGAAELEAIIADTQRNTAYRRRAASRALKALQEGRVKREVPHIVQLWRFGEAATLVALEGEVPSDYALRIKSLFPDLAPVIVLGYSNGVSTYIPTERILREGGYEAESFILHGLRGPLVPENEALIVGTVALMKMELESSPAREKEGEQADAANK